MHLSNLISRLEKISNFSDGENHRQVYAFSYNYYGNFICLSYNKKALEFLVGKYYKYQPSYVHSLENDTLLDIAKDYNLDKIIIFELKNGKFTFHKELEL